MKNDQKKDPKLLLGEFLDKHPECFDSLRELLGIYSPDEELDLPDELQGYSVDPHWVPRANRPEIERHHVEALVRRCRKCRR